MSASSSDVVLTEIESGLGVITLNRPDSANAMNLQLLRALHDAVLRCHYSADVRAVLLRGAGANFCAGGDVREFAAQGESLPYYMREATALLQAATAALLQLQAPVIVAVQGWAAGGGGFGLVCAADLVIASHSARFVAGPTRVGMIPDAGASVTLTQLVGLRRAMDLIMTNRELSASEALDMGLISRVVPDDELESTALDLAGSLSTGATRALAAAKRLVWDGVGARVESRLGEEARFQSELSRTRDAAEGLAAVIERRSARFTGH